MAVRSRAVDVEVTCPLCGECIAVRDNRINDHTRPGELGSCPGAGRPAAAPTIEASVVFGCPACGQVTHSDVTTGEVSRHFLPGTHVVCSMSSTLLGSVRVRVEAVLIPPSTPVASNVRQVPTRARKKKGKEYPLAVERDYPFDGTESVRTTSGGLPGLGKRRP